MGPSQISNESSQPVLPYEEALVEARQHLFSSRPPLGYVWVLNHGQRVPGGWFFWQRFEPKDFINDAHVRFGGGPVAFTVCDDRTIQIHGLLGVPDGVTRSG
jgi:hypothetical protein